MVRPSGVIDSDPNDHGTGRGAHWRKFRAAYFTGLERTALARYAAHNTKRGAPADHRPGTRRERRDGNGVEHLAAARGPAGAKQEGIGEAHPQLARRRSAPPHSQWVQCRSMPHTAW